MNTINIRYGAGTQALGNKPTSLNQASPLNQNTIESTSPKHVLNSPVVKNTPQPQFQDEQSSEKEKAYAKSLNDQLTYISPVEQNKTHKDSLIDEPQLIKNQTAVANYRLIGNIAKRESVQQMLGIDLFA
jgi:hypothetical protein